MLITFIMHDCGCITYHKSKMKKKVEKKRQNGAVTTIWQVTIHAENYWDKIILFIKLIIIAYHITTYTKRYWNVTVCVYACAFLCISAVHNNAMGLKILLSFTPGGRTKVIETYVMGVHGSYLLFILMHVAR